MAVWIIYIYGIIVGIRDFRQQTIIWKRPCVILIRIRHGVSAAAFDDRKPKAVLVLIGTGAASEVMLCAVGVVVDDVSGSAERHFLQRLCDWQLPAEAYFHIAQIRYIHTVARAAKVSACICGIIYKAYICADRIGIVACNGIHKGKLAAVVPYMHGSAARCRHCLIGVIVL